MRVGRDPGELPKRPVIDVTGDTTDDGGNSWNAGTIAAVAVLSGIGFFAFLISLGAAITPCIFKRLWQRRTRQLMPNLDAVQEEVP